MKLEKEPDEERSLFVFHFAVYKRRISIKESGERAGGFNWGCDSWKRERERDGETTTPGTEPKTTTTTTAEWGRRSCHEATQSRISHMPAASAAVAAAPSYIYGEEREREKGGTLSKLSQCPYLQNPEANQKYQIDTRGRREMSDGPAVRPKILKAQQKIVLRSTV